MLFQIKARIVDAIKLSLSSERRAIADLPFEAKLAAKVREMQLDSLLQRYEQFSELRLERMSKVGLGAIVLTLEDRWYDVQERWYFVGFGGETAVDIGTRRFHIVPESTFENLSVGMEYTSEEGRYGETTKVTNRILYIG